MKKLPLFLLYNYILTSSNSYSLENNKFRFIEYNANKNLSFDIFNYISYITMSRTTVKISQSRIEYVFRNIFELPNKNTLRVNILLLIKHMKQGVCLEINFNKLLPTKFVVCNLFIKEISSNEIRNIIEFEETSHNNLILVLLNEI